MKRMHPNTRFLDDTNLTSQCQTIIPNELRHCYPSSPRGEVNWLALVSDIVDNVEVEYVTLRRRRFFDEDVDEKTLR